MLQKNDGWYITRMYMVVSGGNTQHNHIQRALHDALGAAATGQRYRIGYAWNLDENSRQNVDHIFAFI